MTSRVLLAALIASAIGACAVFGGSTDEGAPSAPPADASTESAPPPPPPPPLDDGAVQADADGGCGHTLCDDFETSPMARWVKVLNTGAATGGIVPGPTGNAFEVSFPSGAATAYALENAYDAGSTTSNRVRVAWDMKLQTSGAASSFNVIRLTSAESTSNVAVVAIEQQTNGVLRLLSRPMTTAPTELGTLANIQGKWAHCELEITFGGTGRVKLAVTTAASDAGTIDKSLPTATLTQNQLGIDLGVVMFLGASAGGTVTYDNVQLDIF